MFTRVISRCFCDRDLSALISDVYYNITRAHDYTFRDEWNNRCICQEDFCNPAGEHGRASMVWRKSADGTTGIPAAISAQAAVLPNLMETPDARPYHYKAPARTFHFPPHVYPPV